LQRRLTSRSDVKVRGTGRSQRNELGAVISVAPPRIARPATHEPKNSR
jgi:hypothetical protein